MDAGAFQAAGLYDPTAPNAADRLALLEWLAAQGASLEDMVRAQGEHKLSALAADRALRPGRRLTLVELAAAVGIPIARIEDARLAVGLPPVDPHEPAFSEDDVATFRALDVGGALFGETARRRFARVVGSSIARVAEAAVALFQVNVEGPLRERGGGELALAQQNLRAIEALEAVLTILRGTLRAHMETAIRRFREARPSLSVDTVELTVGFVDLVGFTPLSRRVAVRELAEVVERFEDTANEVATGRDGRVVKLVGDEVMFVTREAAAACDIALTLVERFAGDPAVTPRGGLASGALLVRGGDYYGPIVNLAARLADIAVPREVLVTAELAGQAAGMGLRFEPAGKRMLKGIDEPVALLAVERV